MHEKLYIVYVIKKHNLALVSILKFVSLPIEAKSLPMEDKPKRGRRSCATKALLID